LLFFFLGPAFDQAAGPAGYFSHRNLSFLNEEKQGTYWLPFLLGGVKKKTPCKEGLF